MTPCCEGVPNATERETKSATAHKWAKWLHNPGRLGVPNASKPGTKSAMARSWDMWLHNPRRHARPQRFKARDKISKSPQEGPVATELLPPRRSPPL